MDTDPFLDVLKHSTPFDIATDLDLQNRNTKTATTEEISLSFWEGGAKQRAHIAGKEHYFWTVVKNRRLSFVILCSFRDPIAAGLYHLSLMLFQMEFIFSKCIFCDRIERRNKNNCVQMNLG